MTIFSLCVNILSMLIEFKVLIHTVLIHFKQHVLYNCMFFFYFVVYFVGLICFTFRSAFYKGVFVVTFSHRIHCVCLDGVAKYCVCPHSFAVSAGLEPREWETTGCASA